MHNAAVALSFHRITDVEHLVEDQVLDEVARDLGGVEQPADGDAVVRGVVMAEDGARALGAPSEARRREFAFEEAAVQVLENLFQVEAASARRTLPFVPAPSPGFLDAPASALLEDISQVTLLRFARG